MEFAEIPGLASRIAACNWAVDVWAPLPRLIASLDVILRRDIPVIFEHMGMPDVRAGVAGNEPDPAKLLDLFCAWVDDVELQQKILVDNPTRLYGFQRDASASINTASGVIQDF